MGSSFQVAKLIKKRKAAPPVLSGESGFSGFLDADSVVIVRTETETEIRIISMRKGTANEQKIFFENI